MEHKVSKEKRKKGQLSPEEKNIISTLFTKALVPISVIVAVSLIVLFLGFKFLMAKTSFANFGLRPGFTMNSVSKFMVTYFAIAAINIAIMMYLSFTVLYITLHNIILPVVRITREIKRILEINTNSRLYVRKQDVLFVPLVGLINKLLEKYFEK